MERALRSRRVVGGGALVLLALVGVVIGYATGAGESTSTLPPASAVPQTYARGAVQSLSGDQLTITTDAGPRALKLAPSIPIETLRPADTASIALGDWINGGGVRNAQTVFALTTLVLIRQAQIGAGAR